MVKKFAKNDEGVSAVIGVILMVAITVILAAVIAAFVFSMSGNVSKPYTVGITVKKIASGDVIVTNSGGPDVTSLKAVAISYQPAGATTIVTIANESVNTHNGAAPDLIAVGGSFTIPQAGYNGGAAPTTPTHVIVTGTFNDGKTQVLAETDV